MEAACTRFRTELSAFIDGQLDGKAQSEIQVHLNDCDNCGVELETLRSLTKFLAEKMQPELLDMPDLWDKIEAQMPDVCEVMKEDLSAYLDGELPPAAQEGVNKHLKECPPCLDSFKRMNATNRLLSKGLELPISLKVDLWPAIKAQLNEDCALIRSELSAYADQEVVNLRHRNITNHLIDCHDCRFEFNGLTAVGDAIRDAYKPAIPENFDLWPGIKEKMQVVPFAPKTSVAATSAKAQPTRKRWLVSAVAAAVIGTAGLLALVAIPRADADTMSSESYLIETAMTDPSPTAETAVYEHD